MVFIISIVVAVIHSFLVKVRDKKKQHKKKARDTRSTKPRKYKQAVLQLAASLARLWLQRASGGEKMHFKQ